MPGAIASCAHSPCTLRRLPLYLLNLNNDDTLALRLPDVLERQELSLNLLSKLVMSLIVEKYHVVLEYFPASLKILE